MIYICEYDGTIEKNELLEAAVYLPGAAGLDRVADIRSGGGEAKFSSSGIRWTKCRERILAWLLLEYAVRKERGYSLDELKIGRMDKGKPYSISHPEICFNLSHCEIASACAVGAEKCGIDIERKFPYRESLAKKICHEKEREFFLGQLSGGCQTSFAAVGRIEGNDCAPDTGKFRERQLQILWSLKEAYVKKDGRGLSYGMDRISFGELMPFADTGVCPKHSILWNCGESYTLAACIGQSDFLDASLTFGVDSVICRVSERELILQ